MADNYGFKDAAGATKTHASKDVGGVHVTRQIQVDEANVAVVKAEDALHSSGDMGIMALAVRKDTAAATGGDGDYVPLIVDSTGRLHVTSAAQAAAGDVAHDSADSGNPVKIGGYAKAAAPNAVSADGDRVNAWFDRSGRLVTAPAGVATAGAATKANSFPVVVASDQQPVEGDSTVTSIYTAAAEHVSNDLSAVTANTRGRLRMTQYRELIVAPNMVRAQFFSNSVIASPTDITVGLTTWYNTFVAASTTFFDGSDPGFTSSPRWIRIPMYRFARGAQIGIFNALGVSLGINIRAQITSYTTSNAVNGPKIYTGSINASSYWYSSPMPLGDSVAAGFVYLPQLNLPMEQLVLELTPASTPGAGYFILTVAR